MESDFILEKSKYVPLKNGSSLAVNKIIFRCVMTTLRHPQTNTQQKRAQLAVSNSPTVVFLKQMARYAGQ